MVFLIPCSIEYFGLKLVCETFSELNWVVEQNFLSLIILIGNFSLIKFVRGSNKLKIAKAIKYGILKNGLNL